MMVAERNTKPLGHRCYGSIAHLPGSRTGPGDWHAHEGQARIACEKARDKRDLIIVTEKLDGSNVGVARIDDRIIPLTRAGYDAWTSPFEQHKLFGHWVQSNSATFFDLLTNGERVCGEWLAQAHGTRYQIEHPERLFAAFDIMVGQKRLPWAEASYRCKASGVPTVPLLHIGGPLSVEDALAAIASREAHPWLSDEPAEGAVWRVERDGKFDFMCKFVRHDKQDGKHLPELSGAGTLWNIPMTTFWAHVRGEAA